MKTYFKLALLVVGFCLSLAGCGVGLEEGVLEIDGASVDATDDSALRGGGARPPTAATSGGGKWNAVCKVWTVCGGYFGNYKTSSTSCSSVIGRKLSTGGAYCAINRVQTVCTGAYCK
jgi:hypothetical protein